MKKLNIALIWAALLTFSIGFSGCDDSGSINIFSPSDDVQLGAELETEINASPAQYPVMSEIQNAAAYDYVKDILAEILESDYIEYTDVFPYKLYIIQDDNTINAFAAPGGYIYVYTGLMKFLDREATLAGIMAHEVAHCERRHATQRMTKYYGVSVLLGVVLGDNPSILEEIAANMLTGIGFLYNSREDEYEADEYSFRYLESTQWYPGAIRFFFDKVSEGETTDPTIFEELLSTHPMPQDRIAAVEQMIEDAGLPAPSENNLFTQRYSDFKKLLP